MSRAWIHPVMIKPEVVICIIEWMYLDRLNMTFLHDKSAHSGKDIFTLIRIHVSLYPKRVRLNYILLKKEVLYTDNVGATYYLFNMSRKGRIIVIEGIDKAGKKTQCMLLMKSLKISGRTCAVIEFPDYSTPIGIEIRAFLDGNREYSNELKHMLLSANRWEKKNEIESMVKKGMIVIINRYYQSNLVYGVSNGLDIDWLDNLEEGLPKEDMVIVLDVSSSVSTQRSKGENLDSFEKNQKLLLEVNKNYRKLAKRFKWKIIDGEKSKEQVHKEIMKILEPLRLV